MRRSADCRMASATPSTSSWKLPSISDARDVQALFGLDRQATALALAAFGGGSMVAALALPRLLEAIPDRRAMFLGAALLAGGTLTAAAVPDYEWLLPLWFMIGLGYSTAQIPAGRLLRRSSKSEDRPALFATQFALSHACWLIASPLAGWAGTSIGLPATAVLLSALAAAAIVIASRVWPAGDPEIIEHGHDDLPADHPHLKGARRNRHAHAFVIDDLHRAWPMGG